MKKHCGPITVIADECKKHITFEVKRSPRKADQLGDGNMARVASWALAVAQETGYQVDTTPIDHLLDENNSEDGTR